MKRAYLTLMTILASVILFAQEKTTDINVNIDKDGATAGNWYANPWVWVIGAALFIILLIALTSGSRRSSASSDRVTVTKTVRRDSDV